MDLRYTYDAQLHGCLLELNDDTFGKQEGLGPIRAGFVRKKHGVEVAHRIVAIPPSQLHLLLGRNGSGKSLFFKSLRVQSSMRGPLSSDGVRSQAVLSSSLLVSLPSIEMTARWQDAVKERLLELSSLSDDERYDVPPEYLLQADRPIVSLLEDGLRGAGPGEVVNPLGMAAEDVLEFFGCEGNELRYWKNRHVYRMQLDNGFVHPEGPNNFGLETMVGEFILQGATLLEHNSTAEEVFVPGKSFVSPGIDWVNTASLRECIGPAVRQFLQAITHAELSGDGARLLAPRPEDGPLKAVLDWQASAGLGRADSPLPPFPVGLFETFSLGGLPYVASYEFSADREKVFEIIDVTPSAELRALEEAFEQLVSALTSTEVSETADLLEYRLGNVGSLRAAMSELSDRLAACDLGIAEVALRWPPPGRRWWRESRSSPKSGRSNWTAWSNGKTRAVPGIQWRESNSGVWLDLDAASQGQREVIALFIQLAIVLADRGRGATGVMEAGRHVILLSDEFDRSLHPSAGTAVLEQLAEATSELPGVSVVISTHNVAALARPKLRGVSRIFARRTHNDFEYLSSNESTFELQSDVLGASFLDTLRLARLHILVEGTHDELIIRDLLGGQIPELNDIDLVNGRGLYAWNGIYGNALRFLDAPVLLVHDKRDEQLESEWSRIRESFRKTERLPHWGDTGLSAMMNGLIERKRDLKSRKGDAELEKLLWLLKDHVFDADPSQARRIHLFGLDCDDIVDLLPIRHFPKAKSFRSWVEAHEEFDKSQRHRDGEAFKRFYGINDVSIRRAMSETQDEIHPELVRLVAVIRGLLDGEDLS